MVDHLSCTNGEKEPTNGAKRVFQVFFFFVFFFFFFFQGTGDHEHVTETHLHGVALCSANDVIEDKWHSK